MYADKICSNGLKPPLPYGFAAGRGMDICNGPHRRASRPGRECQPAFGEGEPDLQRLSQEPDEQAIKRLHILGREPARVTTRKALSTTFPKPLWIPADTECWDLCCRKALSTGTARGKLHTRILRLNTSVNAKIAVVEARTVNLSPTTE